MRRRYVYCILYGITLVNLVLLNISSYVLSQWSPKEWVNIGSLSCFLLQTRTLHSGILLSSYALTWRSQPSASTVAYAMSRIIITRVIVLLFNHLHGDWYFGLICAYLCQIVSINLHFQLTNLCTMAFPCVQYQANKDWARSLSCLLGDFLNQTSVYRCAVVCFRHLFVFFLLMKEV